MFLGRVMFPLSFGGGAAASAHPNCIVIDVWRRVFFGAKSQSTWSVVSDDRCAYCFVSAGRMLGSTCYDSNGNRQEPSR
jgi:hypothetical protein